MHKRYENSQYVETPKETLIDIRNACLSIDGRLLLENVNMSINEGDLVYIIGKVGSGKSSLLKTLYAEMEFDEGEATVLGTDLTTLKRRHIPELRRQMGIVFQDFALLRRHTIKENLDFVLRATGWKNKNERNERIEEALQAVELADRADHYPHELSGGEQQRVAIARAILNHPRLIIADEPTGNLDRETASAIITLLKGFTASGTAVVMVTHNMSHLKHFAGRVYECKDNTITELKSSDQEQQQG